MRQKVVGQYPLGAEYCELVLREGLGGEFYYMPEEGHIPRIKVGADYKTWSEVAEVILHESFELALARLKLRFHAEDDLGEDVLSLLFVMEHKDFSDACARVMDFLLPAIPAAERAWREWKRPKDKKSTRRTG